MLMSVIEDVRHAPAYPELAGKRVLITGITASLGVDIVRAFADHRTRLVLQFDEMSEPAQAIAEIAAPAALEIRAFGPIDRRSDAAGAFARTAVQAFKGLDVVINLVPLCASRLPAAATPADVERLVADRLRPAVLVTGIAANRMGLVWQDGLVLNIASLEARVHGRALVLAALIKATLADMTRKQAQTWARQAIRCNAIAPPVVGAGGAALVSEPDVAALALYLASDRGKALSGHVFEAEPGRPAAPSRGALS
jgi:NAD(P)-dependent dehydrogenase (short-subunit alcohol dehydrogenase family)